MSAPPGPPVDGSPLPRARGDVTLVDAVLAILVLLGAQLVVTGVAVAALGVDRAGGGATLMAIVVVAQLVGLAGVLALVTRRGLPAARLLGKVRPTLAHVATGLAVGVGGLAVAYGANAVLVWVSGSTRPVEQLVLQELTSGPAALVLAVVAAVVLAPVTEELAFRVLLIDGLRRRFGVGVGLVASTALFTLVHSEVATSQPLALVGLAALGMVLGVSYVRTGSLVVPVMAHATFNATSLAVAVTVEGLRLA